MDATLNLDLLYTQITNLRVARKEIFDRFAKSLDRTRLLGSKTDLLNENLVLNNLIKQYESTLDVVMRRFRSQAEHIVNFKSQIHLEYEEKLRFERNLNQDLEFRISQLQVELEKCKSVMREAIDLTDDMPT